MWLDDQLFEIGWDGEPVYQRNKKEHFLCQTSQAFFTSSDAKRKYIQVVRKFV